MVWEVLDDPFPRKNRLAFKQTANTMCVDPINTFEEGVTFQASMQQSQGVRACFSCDISTGLVSRATKQFSVWTEAGSMLILPSAACNRINVYPFLFPLQTTAV